MCISGSIRPSTWVLSVLLVAACGTSTNGPSSSGGENAGGISGSAGLSGAGTPAGGSSSGATAAVAARLLLLALAARTRAAARRANAAASGGAAGNSSDERPNVLIVLLDDLGFSDLGAYGGEIRTPNIDSLAAGGTRFRNYYVTPRCSPTRLSLLTGLYTQQAATMPGASLPPLRSDNNVTLPEALSGVGYRTYMAGSGTWAKPLIRCRGRVASTMFSALACKRGR